MTAHGLPIFLSALMLAPGALADDSVRQPAYVYLFSRFSDFVNIDLTEKRIRETLPLIESYRRKHPELQVSATVLFSGALSRTISERNSESGIKDYILEYARQGVIEIGYDGTDEPTYHRRPRADIVKAKTAEDRWLARGEAMERFLTESRDIYGVARPGRSGGLKAMQEVFGEAACITGLTGEVGVDPEIIHRVRRYNSNALMWGIPDPDPARNIHGYRGSAEGFGYFMSPAAHTSPELNWVENVLRSSETSDAAIRSVSAEEGPEALKAVLGKVNRAYVRIVHVEVGDVRIHLSDYYRAGLHYPPLRIAYDHPDWPNLPPEAYAGEKNVAAALARQENALEWLANEFLPANAGSRFVSSSGLTRLTSPVTGRGVAVADLEKAALQVLKSWGSDTYLPNFVAVGDQYLSLADAFYALASVLAEQHRTDKRPGFVRLAPVYGPLETTDDDGSAVGSTSAAAVARACDLIVKQLDNRTWQPLPANVIPAQLQVGGLRVNAAQFLRLMLESIVAPSPVARIGVKMTNMFSAAGLVYPKMRPYEQQGGTWTFRPAKLNVAPR